MPILENIEVDKDSMRFVLHFIGSNDAQALKISKN